MPLNLDSRCIEQFTTTLTAALREARVTYGRYVEPSWMWTGERVAKVLPQTEKSRRAAGLEALPNLTVSFFLMEQLREILSANPLRNDATPAMLSDEPGFEDLTAVARELTAAFVSLPWEYELLVSIPLSASSNHPHIALDEHFALRALDETAVALYPLHPVDHYAQHLYHRQFPTSVASDRYYLAGRFAGYLHDVGPVPQLEELAHAAKGVVGLALVSPILKIESATSGTPPPAQPILAYRIDGGVRQLIAYRWLPPDDSSLFARVTRLPQPTSSSETVLAAIQVAFQDASTRGAARWYLDSFTGTSEVLQTVQAAVALEMLLGDKKQSEQIGVTKLLANRLAFLIGQGPRHREAIIADFVRLYDVRSNVVHNGKAVLDADEGATLFSLREYARRAIVKQLEQIWIESGRPSVPH